MREQLQATLGSAYTLERELGGGGMSRVFLAEETALHRKVVVKVLSPELTAGVNVERFNREILLAAKLQHPHIVPVLTAGEMQGLPYYTMPFVEGESLRARLARANALSITDAVGYLRDVAKALAYAHERGIVHRDIKPDNVLITGGSATVTDFGIAKAISASRTGAPGATLTQLGTSIGTPTYMSPEQAAGDPDTDRRTDIYSFGCMAYELLTGQPPFTEKTPRKLLAAHMGEKPRDVTELRPDTPPALAALVMRCLAKEADERPQQASDLVHVLETVTSSGANVAMPPVLLGGPAMFRKALAVYAGAFVAVAILAKAAIVGIGLPDWVFPGSLVVMALGLPVVLWTGYVQRVTRRALTMTPTYTPGGSSVVARGTIETIALRAAPKMSWYRTARGGFYALGAFIAIIAAFMVMRAFGIGPVGSLMGKGTFGAKETIVVADFKSPAADSLLGVTASEAIRTDLAQSTSLKVLTKAAVSDILRLMKRPTDAGVPFELAREIASREGAKAVLDGSIVQLGSSYVISARLVGALDGAELAQFRRTAKNSDDLVPALGALSKDIRGKVGESLRNVHESNPLERVTTSSLPALKKYVEGMQIIDSKGDDARGVQLLEQAVALDSTFAMAWRRISASFVNQPGGQEKSHAAISQAFRYRERLSENERLLTEAGYYDWGPAPDRERAIAAYEALIERDSAYRGALNNVAIAYQEKRDFAKAEDRYRRAAAIVPPFGGSFAGLQQAQISQRKYAAAESTLAKFEKALPSHSYIPSMKGAMLIVRGNLSGADSLMRAALPGLGSGLGRTYVLGMVANIAAMRGRLRDGERWFSETAKEPSGAPAPAVQRLQVILDSAWVQGYFLGDVAASRATVRRALAAVPMESLDPADRPWQDLLTIAAATHDGPAARGYEASLEKDLPTSRKASLVGYREAMRGMVAVAENRPKDAAALFADAYKADIGREDTGPWRAQAFDLAEQPDSAIVEFERYVAAPDPYLITRRNFLAGSHKRLGELYEAKGNADKAAEHYRTFIEMWKNADPELQPRVADARERLRKLTPVERRKP
ncbi:MAG TPA: protein kinase [Gemmatimonadaceae bacterium]|nr:protein kinase [Gemmatimonadaceae bacterium]